ncbi:hypothetical protein D9M70_597940 [compost metagenome]
MAICRFHQQRQQRERAALPLIVGAQQKQHIFDRDDDRQRPDHQRDQADDLDIGHAVARDRAQRFAKGIERAGADIAIDDPDGAEAEDEQPAQVFRPLRGRGMRLGHAGPTGCYSQPFQRKKKNGITADITMAASAQG